ncbi:MAG: hypothetical protein UD961_04970 [Bacteroidales bacterium]|nr:hypothetical protein [Bacteroidales bacterium]
MKSYLSQDELVSFLRCHNPLFLRDKSNRLQTFDCYASCYYELMVRLYTRYSRGYLDPVLVLMGHFNLSLQDSQRLFFILKSKFRCPNEPFVIHWSEVAEAKKYLKFFVEGFSYQTEAFFLEEAFTTAFDKFYEEYNVKEHMQ